MKCPRLIPIVVCALVVASLGARPQQPGQAAAPAQGQQVPQAKIPVVVNLVVVPVIVKDSDGHLVPDLGKDEFRVLEDNVEQMIDVFANDPFPLSVIVLIDNDLQTRVASQVEASLPAVAGGFSTRDEVLVARYDQRFRPGKGFTTDLDKLLTELQRVTVKSSPAPAPAGGTLESGPSINGIPAPGAAQIPPSGIILKGQPTKTVNDALYEAAQLLKSRGRDRRKIIFLISDGVNARGNKYSFDDTVRALLGADVSVYGVGVGSAYLNRRFTVLSKYANATGGDVFYASKRSDMEALYPLVTEEARNQYTLGYSPRGTDHSVEYHSIEVRVKRPHLTLITREGYYSGPR